MSLSRLLSAVSIAATLHCGSATAEPLNVEAVMTPKEKIQLDFADGSKPGPDNKPQLLDNGFWEIVGGTGAFTGLSGAGTLHIKAGSPTDRKFILDGDLVAKK